MTSDTDNRSPTRSKGYVIPEGAPGWARSILGFAFPAVFLAYLAQTAVGINTNSTGFGSIVGYVALAAFCAVYLYALSQWNSPRTNGVPRRLWVLWATMILLCALVAPFAHEDVWVMYVFVCALAVGMFGGRGLLVVAATTALAMFLPLVIPAWHAGIQWIPAFTIPLISLALFAFFAVVRANAELTEARGEIARLAAEGERSRIARDLHDLLGHSLTSITLKAGLASRLSATDTAAATREIAEVETLARGALSDVRAAVGGYREVTLAGELATAREVLRAAGIESALPGTVDQVDLAHRELFGWVLREGLTNVVRHSRASHCEVTLGPTTVSIVDDGIGGDTSPGNGLTGLRERVAKSGGTLAVGPDPNGGWRLTVDVGEAA